MMRPSIECSAPPGIPSTISTLCCARAGTGTDLLTATTNVLALKRRRSLITVSTRISSQRSRRTVNDEPLLTAQDRAMTSPGT